MDLSVILSETAIFVAGFTIGALVGFNLKKKNTASLPPPRRTEELTDFLNDISTHGYSFTRVDPTSVFVRAPGKGGTKI